MSECINGFGRMGFHRGRRTQEYGIAGRQEARCEGGLELEVSVWTYDF